MKMTLPSDCPHENTYITEDDPYPVYEDTGYIKCWVYVEWCDDCNAGNTIYLNGDGEVIDYIPNGPSDFL
jgi:hypothetical protein